MKLHSIKAIRLVSAAPARLAGFYRALGFAVDAPLPIAAQDMVRLGLAGSATRTAMRLGQQRVEIDCYEAPGRAYPPDAGGAAPLFQHFAMVTTDIAADWARALAAGATPISSDGPSTLPQRSGGATAVKFRDPDGHPLEFVEFAAGADTGWSGTGLLGIDHTASAIVNLDATMAFFESRGLSQSVATHNYGPEQDALDGIAGADAQVIGLSPASSPPHLELLAYKRLAGSLPAQMRISDIAATRIVWRADEDGAFQDPSGHWHEAIA